MDDQLRESPLQRLYFRVQDWAADNDEGVEPREALCQNF